MAACSLMCLTTCGGVPLFTRNKGTKRPLPFPLIGTLNGVQMFAASKDMVLRSTTTENSKVFWKVFQDSITLILITDDYSASDCHTGHFLGIIYNIIVLFCGQEDVVNIKNPERFKSEVKVCYKLFDELMNQFHSPVFSAMTNAVEIIAGPECPSLQNFLDAFCDAAETSFGCVMVHRKVAIATRRWWNLSATELMLLSMLAASSMASASTPIPPPSKCVSQDIPIFLPDESPTVPYRLLIFNLVKNIQVCVLCGSNPTLTKLEKEIGRFWKPALDSLKSIRQIYSRNFPQSTVIDQNILGFLLVNNETHRCLSTIFPKQEESQSEVTLPPKERIEVLRGFYLQTIGTYFSSTIEESDTEPSKLSHSPMETYITTDTHKCYAIQCGPHQFFILYNINIPTYAMRNVSHKALSSLLKDRFIQV